MDNNLAALWKKFCVECTLVPVVFSFLEFVLEKNYACNFYNNKVHMDQHGPHLAEVAACIDDI